MPFKKKLNKLYNWWAFGAGIFLVAYLRAVSTQICTTFWHITNLCRTWYTMCPVYVRPIIFILATMIGATFVTSGVCAEIDSQLDDPMTNRKIENVYFFTIVPICIFVLAEICIAGVVRQ